MFKMSEELLQRDLIEHPQKIGKWDFYNIGSTSIKSLKEHGIIRNVDYGNEERKKVDGIIVLEKKVIAIIEYKKPSEFKSVKQKEKAIEQELIVAKKLRTSIFIATDTIDTIWINVNTGNRILDENKQPLNQIFDRGDENISQLIEKILASINETNDQIKPRKLVNPTDLAKQVWQDIWSVSGATPENCLYTFVELFIFKYLSDLNVLQGIYNFDKLYDNFKQNTEDEVLETYANIIRPKIKDLFPENQRDKTTIINGTIFVSKDQKAISGYSTVFKKILGKFKDYGKLEHIDYDFKSQLFESFLKESISKKNWGQYFTPLKVVRAIVEMAKDEITEGKKICDPACGVGKFLLEPIIPRLQQFFKISEGELKPKIEIYGFDKGFDREEQKTIILAKANMLIYFSDLIKENSGLTKQFSNLFNNSFLLKTNSILGTLSDPVQNEYDLILTNPPYVTSGSSNLKDEIKKDGVLENYFKINALGVEGLFVEWIIRALKRGGKAFVAIPDGILNRQHDKSLRKFIMDECCIDGIISLPINTFFTTNKKTYILCITKKHEKDGIQKEPVFTYLVSEIGETRDVYRFEIDQNDLQEAVTLFSFFKNNKKAFGKINKDKRCKIIDFSEFYNNYMRSWIIDNFWSESEKIELDLLEKDKVFDISEFSLFIGEISNNLLDLQNELNELDEKKNNKIKFNNYKIIDLFEPKLGNPKYTKKYGERNKGKYPVYAASNNAPLTYISTYDYDGDYLTWARNGFAGYMLSTTEKFSVNYDRGILIPKNKEINVDYVKYILEPMLRNIAVGRKDIAGKDEFTKLYLSTMEEQIIPVPVDANNEISRELQLEIINEYKFISELKQELLYLISDLIKINIIFGYDKMQFIYEPIIKYFDLVKGNPIFTNKYIKKHPGIYPVYSSQTSNNGILGSINTYDFDNICLTWTTDGIYAGTVFLRSGKFSMTTHCGALILNEKREDIDLSYIYHYLRNNLKKAAIGEQNKRVTIDIMNTVKVPIPYEGGKINLKKQTEISNKYNKVEEIKNSIIYQISKILEIDPTVKRE
jgi:type I restriction-modification system DNA methylase subunit/restriction endonuclease S subunit